MASSQGEGGGLREIFVFGSNLAGRHGAGSAKEAFKKHGAVWGVGLGLSGSSYAIPTKDRTLKPLPLSRIRAYVNQFKRFASSEQGRMMKFNVVKVGCGLAGFPESDIMPMFEGSPDNCVLPGGWRR